MKTLVNENAPNMYKVTPETDTPYFGLIEQFMASDFPRPTIESTPLLVDLLTNEILGSKLTRLGPRPAVESVVKIRDVIRHYLDKGLPIPFLVPWGSEKPDGSIIDLAELAALKTVKCLHQRISQHYTPGAVFNIRVEDVSAPHLFYDRMDKAREEAKAYSCGFVCLSKILDLDFVRMRYESEKIAEADFNTEADKYVVDMNQYLQLGDEVSLRTLVNEGWSGEISHSTVAFYMNQYEKLYPKETVDQRLYRLARYFAATLARKKLRLRGDDPEWNGQFIDLSFAGVTPGTEHLFGRRVFYRTMPTSLTSRHIPPWRAKGYLLISEDNQVKPQLATFHEELEYVKNRIIVSGNDRTATIQCDYVLE